MVLPKIISAVIVVGVAVVASRWLVERPPQFEWSVDPTPPADIEEAVRQVFAGDRCVNAADAEEHIQARLIDLGRTDWEVSRGAGVGTDGCVSASIDTVQGRIILSTALNPAVKDALAAVADDLLAQCVGRDEATKMVTSVLTSLGETNWEVQSSDLIGGPLDRLDEIKRHAAAGCFVYSGTGWTAQGKRLFMIGGPDAESTQQPSSRS